MMNDKHPMMVGVIANSKELITSTIRSLSDIAHCVPLSKLPSAASIEKLDAIILYLMAPCLDEVRLLARIRATDPFKTVIVVTDGIDTNHHIEFIRLGISDATPITSDQKLISRKLVRAITKSKELVIQSPMLQILAAPAEPLPAFDNRRMAYRAVLPATHTSYAILLIFPVPLRLKVIDLVVATEGRAAGFLLREIPHAPFPHDHGLQIDHEIKVIFELPEGIVSGQANILRFSKGQDGMTSIVVTCTFLNIRDEATIQKLWLDAQNSQLKNKIDSHTTETHSDIKPEAPKYPPMRPVLSMQFAKAKR